MKKLSVYLVAAIILWSYYALSMDEKIEIEMEENHIEESKDIAIELLNPEEEPLRIITIVPDNEKAPDFITVSAYHTTALTISRSRYSEPLAIRLYDLMKDKLIKELKLDGYEIFSEGVITLNDPFVIVVKKEDVKTGRQPLYLCNVETEDIDPLEYTVWDKDELDFGDNKSSINITSGFWKAITIPNQESYSRIMLYNEKNQEEYTFYKSSPGYIKTYLSPEADFLITGMCNKDKTVNFDIYNITKKSRPEHIKAITSESKHLYFSTKNNIFCDYKNIYDVQTGNISQKLSLDEHEKVIGLSKKDCIISNKNMKTLTRYKKNDQKIPLKIGSEKSIDLKSTPINKNREFAVYAMFPWKRESTKLYIYAAPKEKSIPKNQAPSYFSCLLV